MPLTIFILWFGVYPASLLDILNPVISTISDTVSQTQLVVSVSNKEKLVNYAVYTNDISAASTRIYFGCDSSKPCFDGAFFDDNNSSRRFVKLTALSGYGLAFLAIFALPSESQSIYLGLFKINNFLIYMKGLVLIGAFFACWMVNDNWLDGIEKPEYHVLIMLATLGMLLMISANDLISLYIGLELPSLSILVIAANTRSLKSSEAGLKYFLLGALSSGMLLYGSSLIYGFTGFTNFDQISSFIEQNGATLGLLSVSYS